MPGASATGAPYNPFARTLATREGAFGLQRTEQGSLDTEQTDDEERLRGSAGRPALDVDVFKNILMTGSAAPSPPASMRSQRPHDSSSNTDASSISRSSLFDPYLEAHPESPRTSFDQDDSPSESDENEESSKLMTGTGRLDDLAPPAPPKPSYGQPTGPRVPQTVSFADFDESFTNSAGRTLPVNNGSSGTRRQPTIRRLPSDLNKPLPPRPQGRTSPNQATFGDSVTGQSLPQQSIATITTIEESPQQKKAPPPPPTSRRAAHAAPSQGRVRTPSNASQTSSHTQEPSISAKPIEAMSKTGSAAAPPPPPSRKARPTSQSAVPMVEAPPDIPPLASTGSEVKVMPPPPPRRNPSKTGSAVQRTSSASRTSASRNEPPSTLSHHAPPAPPPRRGAHPKRDSFEGQTGSMASALSTRRSSDNSDGRRGSAASAESGRWIPQPNLQQIAEPAEAKHLASLPTEAETSNDVLEELSRFQAEIDALRAKANKGG